MEIDPRKIANDHFLYSKLKNSLDSQTNMNTNVICVLRYLRLVSTTDCD